MEVHAHAHTPRKKWTHFIWEFFMLFLAVTAGFLVENFREHRVERHREKEYMHSLINDLKYDTMNYNRVIRNLERKIPFYDSVFAFLDNPEKWDSKLPFTFYIKTNIEHFYAPAEPTISQLKNSGNLRLVENHLVLDSVLFYDSRVNGMLKNQTGYVIDYNKRVIQLQEQTFYFTGFNHFLNDQISDSAAGLDYDLPLITNDVLLLKKLYNLFAGAKAAEYFYINTIESLKSDAIKLMGLVNKEYHFDN